jgi:long-chain fatty acid transport protein
MSGVAWGTGSQLGAAKLRATLLATVAGTALLATTGAASAGGFYLREQSAEFQGMSYAGDAAGNSLSAMFWNPAATASRDGLNTESSTSAILPTSEARVTSIVSLNPNIPQYTLVGPPSSDIAPAGIVGASYGNYQLTKDIYIGMAVNAPFGLVTKPTNYNYLGAVIAQTTKLTTYNFNPTVAVRIAPGITIGAGAQIETADGTFRFATGYPSAPSSTVDGNGWGFGATAGIMIEASPTTQIGIGYRSQIDQEVNGSIYVPGVIAQKSEATLRLPDVVTASIRQIVSPRMRLDGTFEWTNWSRFKSLTVTDPGSGATLASLPFNWSDGYFVSGGVEYDYSRVLTGRAGVGYEWSPIQSPEDRSPGIPDANRVWLSGGFSWKFMPTTTIDVAYSHLFVADSSFDRTSLLGVNAQGTVESAIDIVSVGVKTHW